MHMAVHRSHLLIIHYEIRREVFDKEQEIVPQCHFEEGVQDCVPNATSSCGAPARPSAVRVAAVAVAVVGAAVAFCGKCSTMCRVFSLHSLGRFSLSFFPHFSSFASCSVSRASRAALVAARHALRRSRAVRDCGTLSTRTHQTPLHHSTHHFLRASNTFHSSLMRLLRPQIFLMRFLLVFFPLL